MSGFAGMFAAGGLTSVVATGGQTIYDGTGTLAGYRFHAFTANGTFTVTSNDAGKTFDAVLIGGGGGAGQYGANLYGGGGGGGGAVTEVTGISLSVNTPYAVVIGSGGTRATPAPGAITTSGSASTWNGYSAAGGIRGTGNVTGGASGNGNAGGPNGGQGTPLGSGYVGGGGGGSGGPGLPGAPPANAPTTPVPAPGDGPVPSWLNGGGGPGYTSVIDGNPYGAGGGGGPNSGNVVNAYTPTLTAFSKITYSVIYGNEFIPGGGGFAATPGINGKGGGAGGQAGGPPSYFNQYYDGGSGRVTIRYPYITAPGEPTNVTAVGGNGQATITFTPPVADGGSSILDYTVTSSPGNITATGSGSPITITGLTNGTTYTFRVKARNDIGSSLDSGASNSVIPGVASNTFSVIATGGQTIYDGTGAFSGYRFHVFTANSNFTITNNPTNKTFDVVIVGGGGCSGLFGPITEGGGGGGGGAVTEVTSLSLSSNTSYAVIVGAGGTQSPGPTFSPTPGSNPGIASIFFGYKAAGGLRTNNVSGGASGNGNAGGAVPAGNSGSRNGSGGGGAGGAGLVHRDWGPIGSPPAYLVPIYTPRFSAGNFPTPYATYYATGRYNGGGGIGYTSVIDGNPYGAGGGGGYINNPPLPGYWNGLYTPEAVPNADTLFTSGGGGLAGAPGVAGKGGGAGGMISGTPNQFIDGGPGTVVIRYPYP